MLLNCGAGEDTWGSLELQGDPTSQSYEHQPWMFTGRTDAEAEVPILWPPDGKSQLTGKNPDSGKDWSKRIRGQQRVRWLDSITDLMDMNLSKLQEIMEDREAWHAAVHGVTKNWLISLVPAMILFHLDCQSSILLFHFQAKLLLKINPTACLLCFFVSCWR